MAVLVIGPSSVGKSTFLSGPQARAFGIEPGRFKLGFELPEHPPGPHDTIHYNLLHDIGRQRLDVAVANRTWNIAQDRILSDLLASGIITGCLVLVAPTGALIRRSQARTTIESRLESIYDSSYWVSLLERVDLFRLYEQLFAHLEQAGIRARVLDSTVPGEVIESDRVYAHAILRGAAVPRPDPADVASMLEDPRCEYQSVLLPYGHRTDPRGYEHLGKDRDATFERVMPGSLLGASVLDIGSALGGLLFAAERRGASTLVGIEPRKDRFEAAQRLAGLLHSRAAFRCCDLADFEMGQVFDHVYVLNVLHHVRDIDGFLAKAIALAGRSLTIEFATLLDEKFRTLHGMDRADAARMNGFPIIGVSSPARADQTYVHAPAAIEQLVLREAADFRLCDTHPSPIADRVIMRFERTP